MADLESQIVISADASGVEAGVSKAKRSLKDLGATAATSGKQASDGLAGIGDGGKVAASKVDSATKNMIGSIQRQIAAMEAGSKSGSDYYRVLAGQRGIDTSALKPYLDQLDTAAAKQKLATSTIAAAGPAFQRTGLSAKEMAFALRGVPAQFTDIATSLQGGQKPLTVFLQQGGQLKDMFGGAGPAAKALGGYVISLINPFTIAAAAAVGLGIAVAKLESSDRVFTSMSTSLLATGRSSVIAKDQIKELAKQMALLPGMSRSTSEATLAEFARTDQIGSGIFQQLALSVSDFAAATGQKVPDAAKALAKAFADPVAGAKSLQDAFGTLSASTMIAIDDMVKHNNVIGAQELLLGALKKATIGVAAEGMTPLQTATEGLRKAWVETNQALDASEGLRTVNRGVVKMIEGFTWIIKNSGSIANALENAMPPQFRASIAAFSAIANFGAGSGGSQTSSGKIKYPTMVPADSGKDLNDQISGALKLGEAYKSTSARIAEMKVTADVLTSAMNKLKAAGEGDSAAYKKLKDQLAGVNEAIANAGKGAAKAALQLNKSQLSSDIEAIKNASEQLLGTYANSEKVMESLRSAGLIGDKDYYAQKRDFITKESAAKEDALQQEIARFKQEKLTGKERVDNDKKIADLQSKIVVLRANSSAQLEVLGNQEEAAANRLKTAFLTARQAAQDYFDTIRRQQIRALDGMGKGVRQRNFDAGIDQIEDKYSGQKRDLENQKAQLELEGKFTDEARQQYEERLRIINEFQDRSTSSYSEYYDELLSKQADWSLGASEALANYLDDSRNVFSQTADLVAGSLREGEDALVNFAKTGKLSFKSLADFAIEQMLRMQFKQMLTGAMGGSGGGWLGGIMGSIAGLFGGTGTIASVASAMPGDALDNFLDLTGHRASGGPVSPNSLYRINEKGPEILEHGGKQYLMTGPEGGNVIPNDKIGGNSQNVSITVNVGGGSAPDVRRAAGQGAREALQAFNAAGRYA